MVPYSGGSRHDVASTCQDRAGNVAPAAGFPVKFDNTPPQNVDGTPDRAPDGAAAWYTHAVTYAFSGTDPSPGSGMGPCDTVTYTGPDTPAASVTGGCSDNAGNRTDASDVFHYDATKPVVSGAAADRAPDHNGWYTHPVAFSFQGTDPTSGIALLQHAHLLRPGRRHGPARRAAAPTAPATWAPRRSRSSTTPRLRRSRSRSLCRATGRSA